MKNIKKIEGVINRYWWDACVLCGLFIFITLLLPFCLALFCNIESRTEWIEATSKIIIPVLAFLISLMILLRTWKQLDNQKEQLDKQVANASKQMAAEQFKNAIAHLGDEKQAIVLGGVHALHNLARNYPEDYSQQVFEVFCSFIREETAKPEYEKKS